MEFVSYKPGIANAGIQKVTWLIKVLHQVTDYDKAHYPNDAVERLQNEEVILYILLYIQGCIMNFPMLTFLNQWSSRNCSHWKNRWTNLNMMR